MRVIGLALFALLAGCYSPSYSDCEITCAEGHCPSGLTCEAGVCRVAGATGACGSMMDAPLTDTNMMGDAIGDTICSYTCYAPSGMQSPVGTAACQATNNGCQANMTWLERIDFCTCSAGQPELYIQRNGTTVNVAINGPARPAGSTYAMNIDGGTCFGTGRVCPTNAVMGCTQSFEVDGWIQIPIGSGVHNFRFFNDDGASGCSGNPLLTFVVTL